MTGSPAYSIRRRQWIDSREITALMTAPFDGPAGEEEFYDRCVNLFPVAMAPMDPGEIAAIRKIATWSRDPQGTSTLVAQTEALMRANIAWPDHIPQNLRAAQLVASKLLPQAIDGVPLLGRWTSLGQQIFNTDEFYFYHPDVLKRDAYPTTEVIGGAIHPDTKFKEGFKARYMSLIGGVTSERFMSLYNDPAKAGPAWMTSWFDMTAVPHSAYSGNVDERIKEIGIQKGLRELCPSEPLPAGMHIAMPTWMLHEAGGLQNVPEEMAFLQDPEDPQQAYISHAILVCPPTRSSAREPGDKAQNPALAAA